MTDEYDSDTYEVSHYGAEREERKEERE